MPRIDLFTSPECPSCPRAREVVAAFAAEHADVEVREWDLATNPGPATGRGIFATPTLILDGVSVLPGVPTLSDLLTRFGRERRSVEGVERVLVQKPRRLTMPDVAAENAIFEAVKKKFGFVPNLIREMSRNPAVARVYLEGQDALAGGVLSPAEQQVVQLAVSAFNECDYCRAAHGLGSRMAGVAAAEIEAIQKGELPDDRRLRSLVHSTWLVLDTRGSLGDNNVAALEAEGIDRAQLYEIVAIVGLKTISNYINHIAHTPIDPAFRQ